jgi:ribosomal protein S18 acetylase RimI-like enzyme
MSKATFRISQATTADDLATARRLFEAYAASLGIDLAYQNFSAELDGLPGKYAPPTGALLLASSADDRLLGCVALRPIPPDGCCEMKRLYVSPEGRGLGLGRALAEAVLGEAIRLGYSEIRLDTLPTMTGALALYEKLGFVQIAPYYDTPIVGTVFLAKVLVRPGL